MTSPVEPDPPAAPAAPAGQLADLLEECLRAERAQPGSAVAIVESAPPELREELLQLLALGRAVSLSSGPRMNPNRRKAVRARIMARITPGKSPG